MLRPDTSDRIFTDGIPTDAHTALDTDSPNRAGAAAAQAQSWQAKARALSDFIAVVPMR